jgi:negative regulator of sigma E activity
MLPLFRPYIDEGEIANLPTYNFYARVSAVLSQEPVSGETVVPEDKGSDSIAKQVVAASRTNYAKKYVPPAEPTNEATKTKRAKAKNVSKDGRPEE